MKYPFHCSWKENSAGNILLWNTEDIRYLIDKSVLAQTGTHMRKLSILYTSYSLTQFYINVHATIPLFVLLGVAIHNYTLNNLHHHEERKLPCTQTALCCAVVILPINCLSLYYEVQTIGFEYVMHRRKMLKRV